MRQAQTRRLAGQPRDRPGLQAIEEEILDALGTLMSQLKVYVHEVARSAQLSPPDVMALRHIDRTISMKELAQRLGCDPSFVTAIADALEERDLVRREIDGGDRRIKNLVLTPSGVALTSRLRREFFAGLPWVMSLDEGDRTTLLELLRKMNPASDEASGPVSDVPACSDSTVQGPGPFSALMPRNAQSETFTRPSGPRIGAYSMPPRR